MCNVGKGHCKEKKEKVLPVLKMSSGECTETRCPSDNYSKNVPTRWGELRRRHVWWTVAGIWRNPAASPVASRWWGCDPCLSRSPEQRASRACAAALWRPAIETKAERDCWRGKTERCRAAKASLNKHTEDREQTLNSILYQWVNTINKHLEGWSGFTFVAFCYQKSLGHCKHLQKLN